MVRAKKEDRREEIINSGLEVFSENGYYNTTTALIAERAGISQPYIFRFFKTKEELFIAALERAFERILQTFKEVDAKPEELVEKMVEAYEQLSISHPHEISLQVVSFSIVEESIREITKNSLLKLRNYTLERFKEAGISNPEMEVTTFLARGILCNISYFMDLPELMDSKVK